MDLTPLQQALRKFEQATARSKDFPFFEIDNTKTSIAEFSASLKTYLDPDQKIKSPVSLTANGQGVAITVEFHVTSLTPVMVPIEEDSTEETVLYEIHPDWVGTGTVKLTMSRTVTYANRLRFHLITNGDGLISGGTLQLIDHQPRGY